MRFAEFSHRNSIFFSNRFLIDVRRAMGCCLCESRFFHSPIEMDVVEMKMFEKSKKNKSWKNCSALAQLKKEEFTAVLQLKDFKHFTATRRFALRLFSLLFFSFFLRFPSDFHGLLPPSTSSATSSLRFFCLLLEFRPIMRILLQ